MPDKALRKAGVTKEKFDRCLTDVHESSPGVNEYAVCTSSMKKKRGITMERDKRRRETRSRR